jgi:hypothetical protein
MFLQLDTFNEKHDISIILKSFFSPRRYFIESHRNFISDELYLKSWNPK